MHQAVFIETRENKKYPVQVDFESQGLSFRHYDGEKTTLFDWAYRDLEFEIGGNRNSLLFVSPRGSSQKIYFEINSAILRELNQREGLKEAAQRISKDRSKNRTSALMWTSAILGVIFALIIFRGPIFGGLGSLIPFQWEKSVADQVLNPKVTAEQQELIRQLESLTGKLKIPSDWQGKFTFHISSNTEPNAYATIGGHIFVNKGLILDLKNSEQLLGVIAHEMAHVKRRHVVRSMAQALGLFSVLQLMIGDVTGLAAIIIDQGGPLLNLQYSRELEEQADSDALKLLSESQIDPIGLSQALQIIREQHEKLISQSSGSEVLSKLQKIEILNSHPDIEKRVKELELKAKEISKGQTIKPVDFDYQKFQTEMKERF